MSDYFNIIIFWKSVPICKLGFVMLYIFIRYTRNLVDEGNGKYNLIVLCWGEGQGRSVFYKLCIWQGFCSMERGREVGGTSQEIRNNSEIIRHIVCSHSQCPQNYDVMTLYAI